MLVESLKFRSDRCAQLGWTCIIIICLISIGLSGNYVHFVISVRSLPQRLCCFSSASFWFETQGLITSDAADYIQVHAAHVACLVNANLDPGTLWWDSSTELVRTIDGVLLHPVFVNVTFAAQPSWIRNPRTDSLVWLDSVRKTMFVSCYYDGAQMRAYPEPPDTLVAWIVVLTVCTLILIGALFVQIRVFVVWLLVKYIAHS